MVTRLHTTDDDAGDTLPSPWDSSWDAETDDDATPPFRAGIPEWGTKEATPSRAFSRVRRGYDADEVDAHIVELEHRLAAAEAATNAPMPPAPAPDRQAAAVELGTVLLDARDTAERIRAEAEVTAAQVVADAEREAREIVAQGRVQGEADAMQRKQYLEADLRNAEEAAAQIRDATTCAMTQISEWRSTALAALERVMAALEQWPGTVPDPVSLEEVLGSATPPTDRIGIK